MPRDSALDALALTTPSTPNGASASSAESRGDRKSTRLNSSHDQISYAVFCLKKKKKANESGPAELLPDLPPASGTQNSQKQLGRKCRVVLTIVADQALTSESATARAPLAYLHTSMDQLSSHIRYAQ